MQSLDTKGLTKEVSYPLRRETERKEGRKMLKK